MLSISLRSSGLSICRLLRTVRYTNAKSIVELDSSRRSPSLCKVYRSSPVPKPCFSLDNISIERGNLCHTKLIRSFLYTHHWPREPSITGLWISLNSNYLGILTEKYATSGDRLLAFERQQRTGERKLVGVLIASQIFPWTADELEEWAHLTTYIPDRHHMYFSAHCQRAPNLFKTYHCDYIYAIEALVTASEVMGQGLATLLVRTSLEHARELRHPVTQLVATSTYAQTVCERCGMQGKWSMKYSDYVDENGRSVFYPRTPHKHVKLYIKPFTCAYGSEQPCKPPYL